MGGITKLEKFHAELVAVDKLFVVDPKKAKGIFTDLFSRGCDLLSLDDNGAAEAFGTSVPTVSRWRRGAVIPPAAELFLRFLREDVEERIRVLRNATPKED